MPAVESGVGQEGLGASGVGAPRMEKGENTRTPARPAVTPKSPATGRPIPQSVAKKLKFILN
jgi:hypothetical protein